MYLKFNVYNKITPICWLAIKCLKQRIYSDFVSLGFIFRYTYHFRFEAIRQGI